jgi:hypothetical protein
MAEFGTFLPFPSGASNGKIRIESTFTVRLHRGILARPSSGISVYALTEIIEHYLQILLCPSPCRDGPDENRFVDKCRDWLARRFSATEQAVFL